MNRVWLAAFACVLIIASSGTTPADADPPVGHYREFGDAGGFANILPAGQDGILSASDFGIGSGAYNPHMRDQLAMYSDLVYNAPGLTDAELPQFFKDASFGVPENDIERVYSPTANVTVVRDRSHGVPHIFGTTRYATMFAQGYTGGEDRMFLIDIFRHVGRGRLSEFLGPTAANQALDRDTLALAPYLESEMTAQLAALAASGPEGQAIIDDINAYVDGLNQFITEANLDPSKKPVEYTLLGQPLLPAVPEDAIAAAANIGGIFGKGGGGELRNHCGLKSLTVATGSAAAARAIFDDLHFANDDEAPTTSQTAAPYMTNMGPVDPLAHPDVDCDTLDPVIDDGGGGGGAGASIGKGGGLDASLFFDRESARTSNALLVSGAHTATGAPIAIFGPQTGYYVPQLLIEKDVHGPGIDARGMGFAGIDAYIQIGRGTNYAWSATSSGADNVDQFVLELCEPGGGTPSLTSMGYLRNSVCELITTYQHVQNTTSGTLSWRVERTAHYGPISERALLEDSTPVAIASLRTTYTRELESARGFYRVNNPASMTGGYTDFQTAMGGGIDYTFNWFYVDGANIGYQHSCRCPQRASGVDPYLPPWGTGAWDWAGFIPLSAQPAALNPAEGYLSSWNNKPAPEFMANDRNFSYGPVYRNQALVTRIEAAIVSGGIDRAEMADIMEDAGTVDLRGQEVLPYLLDVLGPTAPITADSRAQDMRDRLEAWMNDSAHRRDFDEDGQYDDPQAPAIMDAWWPRIMASMFAASSDNAFGHLGIGTHDAPQGHGGSAFGGGAYAHVQKDLRSVLGLPVTDPWSQTYCGGGVLATCSDDLWVALSGAASDLQTDFGSPLVVDWKRAVADDDIRSTAVGVSTVPAFHWVNRPTFQQLVQINGGCAGDYDCDTMIDGFDNCPAATNASLTNEDRNFIELVTKPYDDATLANSDGVGDACDPDDDNDGLADLTETGAAPCASATGPTNALLRDTDGDRALDGAECALGTNPNSTASAPTIAACGSSADADGDGVINFREFCYYGTNPLSSNTDADSCGDRREIASINGDQTVNVIDLQQVAQEGGAYVTPGSALKVNFDITKNGVIDVIDLQQVAAASGACP